MVFRLRCYDFQPRPLTDSFMRREFFMGLIFHAVTENQNLEGRH